MIRQTETDHRVHHRHRPRQHAGIVSATRFELDRFAAPAVGGGGGALAGAPTGPGAIGTAGLGAVEDGPIGFAIGAGLGAAIGNAFEEAMTSWKTVGDA